MTKTTVLYHAVCYDGFTAAWVLHRVMPDADFRAVKYGDPPPDDLQPGVLIVDFSYPRDVLLALSKTHGLFVLDHHKTAEADLSGLPFATFDMQRSGAGLAWDHFHGGRRPLLVDYVEDRDLWRFDLRGSREVSAWLRSFPMTWQAWDAAAGSLEDHLEGVITEGASILQFTSMMVNVMADQARMQDVGGYRIPVANATVFFSEVGEALCLRFPDAPFAAYYLDRADGKRQWGLRSRNGFDVSAVAKAKGGGGHPAAAGFVEPMP